MPDASGPISEASFIDAPRDSRIKALFAYWNGVRGERKMPARADIDPAAIPRLLPHVFMYGVSSDGGYTIRLVGEDVVSFVGHNATGSPAGTIMPPRSAEVIVKILDAVTNEQVPKFRAGKAHWLAAKSHRDYEACFLPLSADGESVNVVLGGVVFPNAAV
ncbi:MAG TPA: PAS domain-containing protein [Stellaceae bacterium]|nr:PAS domain-containing protein [Stellaceae bacterium]